MQRISKTRAAGALCALLSLLISLPSRGLAQAGEGAGATDMRRFIELYSEDRASLRRYFGIPMSPRQARRLTRFLSERKESLGHVDFDGLDSGGRIDYLLTRNELSRQIRRIEHGENRDREVRPFVPFWKDIVELAEARRAMEPVEPPAAAQRLADVRVEIEAARGEAEAMQRAGSVRKTVANRAASRVGDLRDALRRWFRFYGGYDPLFSWWVRKPYERLDAELEKYAKFLRGKIAGVREDGEGDILGDPIGRKALLDELAFEMIPYTPEELIEIAEREFAWCEAEMIRASRDLGFGKDWKKALNHVKKLHVPPGKQPHLIRELAVEAIDFLEKHELVTIPPLCRETWRMEMMSPERQRVNPYFTGGEVISVSFPTDEMTHEEKLTSLRGNNIHFSRATVHHELIPGHHLQGFMARRYRPYRRIFRTPFLVEGWALYWEMLLWDLDFARSPENRVGMLFWRTHRCARIIFSLSFHLEKMTAQEAIDFLVERVGHERKNAAAEVRRSVFGNYGPLYQCAYMLGGLQLRALYRELVESGKMTDRRFHDAVLRENAIPIELIRASLTGQELTRDFAPRWRFADGTAAD